MIDNPKNVAEAWDMICPACEADHSLDVTAVTAVRLTRDGTDADESADGATEWDDDSLCQCVACGWTGLVRGARNANTRKTAMQAAFRAGWQAWQDGETDPDAAFAEHWDDLKARAE